MEETGLRAISADAPWVFEEPLPRNPFVEPPQQKATLSSGVLCLGGSIAAGVRTAGEVDGGDDGCDRDKDEECDAQSVTG